MATIQEIFVPDIGDYSDVEIIEVLVAPGDVVAAEDSLITLESDKASMEVPSPVAGTVKELKVQIGDRVSEGSLVLLLETEAAGDAPAAEAAPAAAPSPAPAAEAPAAAPAASGGGEIIVTVPDIGDYSDVEIIELLVGPGDSVSEEDSLITLESDKASMEVPSPAAGVVKELKVQLGDRVSEGSAVLVLTLAGGAAAAAPAPALAAASAPAAAPAAAAPAPAAPAAPQAAPAASPTAHIDQAAHKKAHASPGVRRFARELGCDLSLVKGSGPKGRVLKDDIKAFIKDALAGAGVVHGGVKGGAGLPDGHMGIPPIPEVDFSKFGEIERVEMGRIPKLSAANLHRAWLNLPMVTHHDEADITEMEDFRKSLKADAEKKGVRVTGLVFHMKALAACLMEFPKFNSSLTSDGQALIYKKFCNIGIAVDTPNGLVVPVFKDVDKKSIYQLSEEMSDISARARVKKLKPDEMQGACMTISSLGGIGGTAFTPIVNAPEVAILGITRARMQPVWNGKDFTPRLMCPLDLTYDHRVIDGADAARFLAHYCQVAGDIRRLLL
jgi:pyruvate dehydrogenase E2 component (dihydrolipoamide acetyltransferase)